MHKKYILLLLVMFFSLSDLTGCQIKPTESNIPSTKEKAAIYWVPSTYTTSKPSGLFKWDLITKKESFITTILTMEETLWTSLSPDKQKLVCAVQNDAYQQKRKKNLFWTYQYYKDDHGWDEMDHIEEDSDFQSPYWFPDSSGFLYMKAMKQTQVGDFIHYESYNLMDVRFATSKAPKLVHSFQSLASSLVWSPGQTSVAFFAQIGKEMKLWIYNTQTGVLSSPCTVEADQYSKNRIHWLDENTIIWLEIKTLFTWDIGKQQKSIHLTMPEVILGFDFYLPSSSICMVYTLTEPSEKTVCVLYSWLNKKSQIIATGYQIDSPRFSPDGSKILFFHRRLSTTKPELMVFLLSKQDSISVCSVGKITIFPWDTNPTYAVWSPDSQLILFENKQDEYSNVQLYSISPLRLIKDLVQSKYIYAYSFSPSGDWIRVLYPQDDQTIIMLYHQRFGTVGEFNGEWLGWTTEDFS